MVYVMVCLKKYFVMSEIHTELDLWNEYLYSNIDIRTEHGG